MPRDVSLSDSKCWNGVDERQSWDQPLLVVKKIRTVSPLSSWKELGRPVAKPGMRTESCLLVPDMQVGIIMMCILNVSFT